MKTPHYKASSASGRQAVMRQIRANTEPRVEQLAGEVLKMITSICVAPSGNTSRWSNLSVDRGWPRTGAVRFTRDADKIQFVLWRDKNLWRCHPVGSNAVPPIFH
jgi:hypothetical protein